MLERGGPMPDTALVVMARYPVVGATKTRLARVIGVEEAVRLYRAFLTAPAHGFARQPHDPHPPYTPHGPRSSALMATLPPSPAPHTPSLPPAPPHPGRRL